MTESCFIGRVSLGKAPADCIDILGRVNAVLRPLLSWQHGISTVKCEFKHTKTEIQSQPFLS